MYNKYLGGTKVIKYVVNREKYKRRKESRNKIKVWNPDNKTHSEEVTVGHAFIAFIVIAFVLKLIF